MIQEFIERCILETPVLGGLYRKRAAKLKRGFCLFLNYFGMLKPISFVQWLVTNQCNATCPFCEASAGQADANELTFDEAKALIRDLQRMRVRRLILSGGEPLVRPDICEIMDYATQCNLGLGLVTNGWYVPEMESRLGRFKFFFYFTSIDGEPAQHDKIRGIGGAFDRALAGLARICQDECAGPDREHGCTSRKYFTIGESGKDCQEFRSDFVATDSRFKGRQGSGR